MSSSQTALIGNDDILKIFRAFGAEVFGVNDEASARSAVEKTRREDYKVVFITESWAMKIGDILKPLPDRSFPVFIAIPERTGASQTGMEKLRLAARRAIGSDRLFSNEDSKSNNR